MRDAAFLLRPAYSDQQRRANRDGAHPKITEFERTFIRRMRKRFSVPLFAHNVVRTHAEQVELYVQGVTKALGGESPHNYGMAADIVHSVKAWNLDGLSWSVLGHVGKEVAASLGIKVVWGGDWRDPNPADPTDVGWDPAHWELAEWRSLKQGYPFS